MAFTKVTRRQARLRLALTGVSGAGKTLSALYIAYGMTGDWSRVALIDTEHERARFYADREDLGVGEFLYCPMEPPFSPDKYKALVLEGAKAVGSDGVVIVDSFTHAWSAEGGILDLKDRIAAKPGKNSYTAWNEAGREQSKLVNTILAVDCHTIVNMRSKMEYAMETDDRGRQKPVKIGLAPIQRDDTEYEFDIVLDIGRDHVARASKDTTFLDKYGEIITPALGEKLRDWLAEGEAAPAAPASIVPGPICTACGKLIIAENGSSAEQIAEKTTDYTGQPLCWDCYKRWYKAIKANAAAGEPEAVAAYERIGAKT